MNRPNIVIHVSGGVVQGITSDSPINVLLRDEDSMAEGDSPQWGFPVGYDVDRVAELLKDPTAEVDTEEFELPHDVKVGAA